MRYRVWDTNVNRLFGTYDNEAEALALVRTLVGAYGERIADALDLGREHPDGSFDEPISGPHLLARAHQAAEHREAAEPCGGEAIIGTTGVAMPTTTQAN